MSATITATLDKAWVDGEWVEGSAGSFEIRSPHTGEIFNSMTRCDESDVARAVEAARRAQPGWAATPLADRVQILRRIAELLRDRGEELAQTITAEIGKTILESREEVFEYAAPAWRRAAEDVVRFRGVSFPSTQERTNNKRLVLSHRPLGVIGVITPYNFPTDISSIALSHAIAVGNTAVWKPSEYAPTSCALVAEITSAAGLPAGVINFVPGLGDAGQAIVEHPGVDGIFLTGSTKTGEWISAHAGLKRLLLELGGDGPQIVLADADLDAAVEGAMLGCFFFGGQVCTSSERILVHEGVHDKFVEKLKARVADLKIGDPRDEETQMGPLCNEGTLERVQRHVDDAVARGAQVSQYGPKEGLYYPATILTGVTPEMEIARSETFGPVAPVMKIGSTEEAIEIANSSELGLTASVYTQDLATAWTVGEALQHGAVNINESTNYWDQLAPFGGAKKSGVGRELSLWFFEAFTEPKLIVFDIVGRSGKAERLHAEGSRSTNF